MYLHSLLRGEISEEPLSLDSGERSKQSVRNLEQDILSRSGLPLLAVDMLPSIDELEEFRFDLRREEGYNEVGFILLA